MTATLGTNADYQQLGESARIDEARSLNSTRIRIHHHRAGLKGDRSRRCCGAVERACGSGPELSNRLPLLNRMSTEDISMEPTDPLPAPTLAGPSGDKWPRERQAFHRLLPE